MAYANLSDEERKAKLRENARRYRERHPDKVKAQMKRYREKNPAASAAKSKEWRETNPEKMYESRKRWAESHREQQRATRNAWHAANNETIREKRRARYAKRADEIRQRIYEYRCERKRNLIEMLGGKCMDCTSVVHLAAFEFDHVRGTKTRNISMMLGGATWEALVEEAKKCDLVCANCHRIRTAARTGRV